MSTRRQDRVANLIREEVASMISRGEAKDPGVESVTVTGARVSPDLRLATVFFSALGDESAQAQVEAGLKRSTPFFRREIGRRLGLRFAPELLFRRDSSLSYGQEVEAILERIHGEPREEGSDRPGEASPMALPDPDPSDGRRKS